MPIKWHLTALYPDGAGSSVNDIYCQRVGDCIAVGFFSGNRGSSAPMEYYQDVNGKWSTEDFPNRYNVDSGELNALWCSSLLNCVAVGTITALNATRTNLFGVELERNGRWTSPSLEPAKSDHLQDGYTSVRCTSINNCAITGTYELSPKNPYPGNFCTNLSNGRLSIGSGFGFGNEMEICNLKGASPGYALTNNGSYTPLACPSKAYANCIFVSSAGLYGAVSGTNRLPTKALKVNVKPPHFEKPPSTVISGNVSCSNDGLCADAGTYIDSRFGQKHAYLTVGRKGHWSSYEVTPPNFGSNGFSTGAVKCFGTMLCISTSIYSPPIGSGSSASKSPVRGAVTIYYGGEVQTLDIPSRSNVAGFDAYGISCPSTKSCTLVGSSIRNGALYAEIVTLTAKE